MRGEGRRGSQVNSTWSIGVGHVECVDDEPVLLEAAAFELESEQAAHDRARAVGPDEVARANLGLAAVGVRQLRRDLAAIVREPGQLDAQAHLDARVLGEFAAQELLELRLVEGHERRLAVDDAGAVDAREAPEQRRAVLDLRDRHGRELAVAHAGHLEDAQRLVVERDRARLLEDRARLVDDQHAQAIAAEQVGERAADRTQADQQHVGVDLRQCGGRGRRAHGAVMRVVCSPRSMAPSSVRIDALMRSPGRR